MYHPVLSPSAAVQVVRLHLCVALSLVRVTNICILRSSEQSAQLGDPSKSIFSNGFAPGCYWSASGAFNITEVLKAGQDGDTGLCTTFPQAGVSNALV